MSKKILLVDDQEIERTALRGILSAQPDWIVFEADDGDTALDLLCSGLRPQICLVDLRMARIDGLEFLRRVRRDLDLRGLKVLITSVIRDRSIILDLAKLGIEGYLLKPFGAEKTLAVLRPIMDAMPDPDSTAAPQHDLLTKTAMIIDDDPLARTMLAGLIAMEPHWKVIEVADGKEALAKLQGRPLPDICFLDLQMPGMDGVAVLSAIRSDPRSGGLRVAVTSVESGREKIKNLAKLGIEAYLLKPFDRVKVRAALRAVA